VRRLARLAVVALAAASLGGCTLVSASSAPTVVNSANVPLELLSPTIPFTLDQQVHFVIRDVYLVNARGTLVAVGRLMPSPPDLNDVLHYLLSGPTPTEQGFGITSAIPATLAVNLATPDGRVAKIDVSSVLRQLSPLEQRVAVAQLLYTVSSIGFHAVAITTNQSPFTLVLASGRRVRVVTTADLAYLK